MTENFKKYLQEKNFSENTVKSYVYALRQFAERFPAPAKQNLKKHREWLIAQYCPQTVNLRLRAINCYLESTGRADRKLSFVRMQQKPFAENVISQEDYIYFKNRLREDDEWLWYFVIRFFAATGVRVNELTKLKVEDVRLGHLDIYSKGGKMRRIYMPKALQEETLFWLREICRQSGFLFLNRYGSPITPCGISGQLKNSPCAITSTRMSYIDFTVISAGRCRSITQNPTRIPATVFSPPPEPTATQNTAFTSPLRSAGDVYLSP